MSKYQPYPEYIDIKNNFIDTLPLGWVLSKLKYEIDYVEGPGILATDFHDIGVPLLRIQNIKGRFTTGDIKTYLDPRKVKDKWEHFKVLSGDLLISGSASTDLIAEVTEPYEGAVPYTGLIRLRAKKERTDKHYIRYFVQSELFKNQIDNLKTGSTIQHFGPIHLQQIVYPSSSIEQQQQIAAFLDHETAKIDTLIEKQQQLIELLKEKRQAVISHAVTKGLNPDAPMKDSGVEWLGEVPEHWELPRLKQIIQSGSSISYGIVQPGDALDEGVPFIQTTNISQGTLAREALPKTSALIEKNYPRSRLMGGEVILGIRASIGAAYVVPNELRGVNLSRGIARIQPNNQISSEFLVWLFKTNAVEQYWGLSKQGSTFSEVSIETVREMNVLVPPMQEQQLICKELNLISNKYDQLINAALAQNTLLRERRTALISAAVTGKIDVRHFTLENGVTPATSSDTNEAVQEVMA